MRWAVFIFILLKKIGRQEGTFKTGIPEGLGPVGDWVRVEASKSKIF